MASLLEEVKSFRMGSAKHPLAGAAKAVDCAAFIVSKMLGALSKNKEKQRGHPLLRDRDAIGHPCVQRVLVLAGSWTFFAGLHDESMSWILAVE